VCHPAYWETRSPTRAVDACADNERSACSNLLQVDEYLGVKLDERTEHAYDFSPGRTLPPRVFSAVEHGTRRVRRLVDTRLRIVRAHRRAHVNVPVTEKLLRRQVSARHVGLHGLVKGHVDWDAVGRDDDVDQQRQQRAEAASNSHRRPVTTVQ